jgi:hypothetical protein
MNLDELREFFGWCTVINFGILLISTVAILAAGKTVARIHGRMFGTPEPDVMRIYFQYLSTYKVLVLAFNFAPWLALRIMG